MKREEILKEMIENRYRYMGETHKAASWQRTEKELVITNEDGHVIKVPKNEEFAFFENVAIIKEETRPAETKTEKSGENIVLHKNYSGIAMQLKAVLLDSIDKVTDNPDYIKQANAIVGSANAIMNIYKLELQMVRMGGQK